MDEGVDMRKLSTGSVAVVRVGEMGEVVTDVVGTKLVVDGKEVDVDSLVAVDMVASVVVVYVELMSVVGMV